MNASRPDAALRDAQSPEAFRTTGHRIVDLLADYLARAEQGAPMTVLPPHTSIPAMAAAWPSDFPSSAIDLAQLSPLLERVLADSNHLHHPRYVGHQVSAPLPLAALMDLVSALLNNGMAVFEMGPSATAMERALVRFFADRIGFGAGADGVLTSGGSLGTLTALLAARQSRAGFDAWTEGASGGPPSTILVSEQAHYSVDRAARIMGFGAAGVQPVPVDERYRMRPDALPESFRAAERAGRRVIAVVASACSTATGAFDPIEPIADFCAAHDLWLHVDGAHGASAALSPRYRSLLSGIERADSVVWDAHKMMMMPALVTAVLFRDRKQGAAAFAQRASYLLDDSDAAWNVGARTVECTKRMMSLKLYAALALFGTDLFAAHVERCFDLGARLAAKLRATPRFEVAVEPQCNIVCFRHVPSQPTDVDEHQARIRRQLLASGRFYVVQARLGGALFLRTTLMNPLTTDEDLDALIAEIVEIGQIAQTPVAPA